MVGCQCILLVRNMTFVFQTTEAAIVWCFSLSVLGDQVVSIEAAVAAVQNLASAVPISVALAQTQATMPITVQGCPQVRA